ncbi:hypothetical protein J2Z44_003242 [Clostridium punense]|uniref:Ig-like domain-containing protein n=1 Tax=Clostridium punense TaxID=1054297 RepID=A0ABS4K6K1_9CLOT|nr:MULTISPECIES: hypothetical protein [Clostridium]EQB89851.1 hypothetical protein M918_18485 [Clostridium sp. BL8]MBP2023405.1 hypothetical protein [Clostridium punense]
MKKLLIPVLIIVLIIGGGGAAYKYFNGPKIVEIAMTKSVDDKGKPTAPTSTFTSKDTVYLSAKGKKLAIKKATVVWYKGEVLTQNRFKTEENIEISKAGYFNAKLSVPEGLEEGEYGVTIYNGSNDIIEKMVKFQVKN